MYVGVTCIEVELQHFQTTMRDFIITLKDNNRETKLQNISNYGIIIAVEVGKIACVFLWEWIQFSGLEKTWMNFLKSLISTAASSQMQMQNHIFECESGALNCMNEWKYNKFIDTQMFENYKYR